MYYRNRNFILLTELINYNYNFKCTKGVTSNDEKRVIVQATVTLDNGKAFTGYSQAEWGKGLMGAVALEVAETSAVGRALGFANIGLVDGIASADEVRKAGKPKSPIETDEAPDLEDNNFEI